LHKFKFCTSALLFLFLSSCLPLQLNQKTAPSNPYAAGTGNFAAETAALNKKAAAIDASKAEKAEAHYRLAILQLNPRNPDLSYRKAEAALQKYRELTPADKLLPEATFWLAALQKLKELEEHQADLKKKISELRKQSDGLIKERTNLDKNYRDLEEVNGKLKKDIEKLKYLDLSLEKKRKSFR